jgi:hypothetical protein
MVSKPCPHCGTAIRQSRPDWLCVACGKLLPEELRASKLLPGLVLYNGVPMDPSHIDRINAAQTRRICLVKGQFYNRMGYGEEKHLSKPVDDTDHFAVAHGVCPGCSVLKGQFHVGPECRIEQCACCARIDDTGSSGERWSHHGSRRCRERKYYCDHRNCRPDPTDQDLHQVPRYGRRLRRPT